MARQRPLTEVNNMYMGAQTSIAPDYLHGSQFCVRIYQLLTPCQKKHDSHRRIR
jgi:hypothetical protein